MKNVHKGDISFALLMAFFLCWNAALRIKVYSLLNITRLLVRYIALAVAIEVMFALVSYLRNRPLFGQTPATFFAWKKVLPWAIVISGSFSLFYYFYLDGPITTSQVITLIIGGVIGAGAVMLYFYSLVKKD